VIHREQTYQRITRHSSAVCQRLTENMIHRSPSSSLLLFLFWMTLAATERLLDLLRLTTTKRHRPLMFVLAWFNRSTREVLVTAVTSYESRSYFDTTAPRQHGRITHKSMQPCSHTTIQPSSLRIIVMMGVATLPRCHSQLMASFGKMWKKK
jgi:hypothetical protein